MKIGVMVSPERGDTARKVARLLSDIAWAEAAGLPTAWIPQVPNDMDALQCVALLGAHTSRIELGTAVVPLQAQHPVALARQALSAHAITGGRLILGVGPSHHWLVSRERDVHRVQPVRRRPGRPAPRVVAGIPVTLCAASRVDEARARANRILAEAEFSPNYQRLLEHGDIRDVGELLAAGDEAAIAARFRRFADAGATDLSIRLLPIGTGRDELIASKHRTRELLAALAADFA